jgi:hypothetical protein
MTVALVLYFHTITSFPFQEEFMIYHHDLLPETAISIPGPLALVIDSLHPDQIQQWVEAEENCGIAPNTATIAGQRHIHAYGFGS